MDFKIICTVCEKIENDFSEYHVIIENDTFCGCVCNDCFEKQGEISCQCNDCKVITHVKNIKLAGESREQLQEVSEPVKNYIKTTTFICIGCQEYSYWECQDCGYYTDGKDCSFCVEQDEIEDYKQNR